MLIQHKYGSIIVRLKSVFLGLIIGLLGGILILQAGYKIKPLSAPHANAFLAKDVHDKITVAVEPYDQPEKIRQVFDVDFSRANFKAILLVVSNDSEEEIELAGRTVELTGARSAPVMPTPAEDVVREIFYGGSRRGQTLPSGGVGLPGKIGRSKPNAKDYEEARIDFLTKEFGEKLIRAHSTAFGIIFYEVGSLVGRKIYVPSVRVTRSNNQARVGRELMFFEVDLKPAFVNPQ